MNQRLLLTLVAATATTGCTTMRPGDTDAAAQPERLRAAETAFAATMAARDIGAFATFIADDAIFINGGKPLRGKAAIVEHWRRFYNGPRAPFSWKPETVEVIASGRLGYSEGPVADPDGVVVARYASTWRLDAAGEWKVVFDNGTEACRCAKSP